jgi:hypothetical protein
LVLEKVKNNYSLQGNVLKQKPQYDDSETSAFANNIYSASIKDTIPKKYLYGITKIIFEAQITSNQKLTEAGIVFDISRNGKNIYYQKSDIKDYVVENKFEKMQFMIDVPNNLLIGDLLTIYLYNPTKATDKVTMKKVSLTYIKLLKDE